jgi:hypothetical protein
MNVCIELQNSTRSFGLISDVQMKKENGFWRSFGTYQLDAPPHDEGYEITELLVKKITGEVVCLCPLVRPIKHELPYTVHFPEGSIVFEDVFLNGQ